MGLNLGTITAVSELTAETRSPVGHRLVVKGHLNPRLAIDYSGEQHVLAIKADSEGVHVGCTHLTWPAWELLAKKVRECK